MIEVENLVKRYGNHLAVDHLTFQVEPGKIYGFLGPNGAGKSTTIRSMLGLIKYDQGEIRINGLDSVKDREKILADIGYMPSEAWFYPGMKIREILKYSAAVSAISGISRRSTGGFSVVFMKLTIRSRAPALENTFLK